MEEKFGKVKVKNHFADTSDTLCYATYDNQQATMGLLNSNADFAIVVGGYNSSNTSHIVELCEQKLPVYFISGADKIFSEKEISHYDIHSQSVLTSNDWLVKNPGKPTGIILTSGASCPDAILDEVLQKILAFFSGAKSIPEVLIPFNSESSNN